MIAHRVTKIVMMACTNHIFYAKAKQTRNSLITAVQVNTALNADTSRSSRRGKLFCERLADSELFSWAAGDEHTRNIVIDVNTARDAIFLLFFFIFFCFTNITYVLYLFIIFAFTNVARKTKWFKYVYLWHAYNTLHCCENTNIK